jgi:amino acid transporter
MTTQTISIQDLLNLLGASLLLFFSPDILPHFMNDGSYISWGIVVLFLIGLLSMYSEMLGTSVAEMLSPILVTLGLIGTVVGLMVTSASLAPDANALEQVLAGFGIAFWTTLVGAATSVWLELNISLHNL